MDRLITKVKLPGTAILLFNLFCSCNESFLDIAPPIAETPRQIVFSNDKSATAAIVGIYSEMIATNAFAGFSIGYYGSISADELFVLRSESETLQFANNSILSSNSLLLSSFWEPGYRYIWYANSIIEGLSNSNNVSNNIKVQLLGEAKFVRAFCHFYLTALFGDIPYISSTDYRINSATTKSSHTNILNEVIEDLTDAQNSIGEEYISTGRVRPNHAAVTALLARVYLYSENWSAAEREATKVIADVRYYLEPDLDDVFLATSNEAIWQLMPVQPGSNTSEAQYITSANNGLITLSPDLINSFENKDRRRQNWIDSNATLKTYYPFKYKVSSPNQSLTEYTMVLRLAEQFLIRAEARAQNNNLKGPNSCESDLNVVRNRAGLDNTAAVSKNELLDAILNERRFEYFTEWAHRWLDLKRTNNADKTLSASKPNWSSTDLLYPIPISELNKNANLLPQNEGYQ